MSDASNLVESAGDNPAVSMISGDWLKLGMQVLGGVLGGKSTTSQSGGASQGALNTSGWNIGSGSAEGADLTTSGGGFPKMPWYVWAVGTLIAVAIVKKAV